MDPSDGIINVNEYQLIAGVEPFVSAISALANRTESEGHPGVVSYRWFVNEDEGSAAAVIIYENADAWVGHHQLAYEWEEMPSLQATVSLRRLVFMGQPSAEIREWVGKANLPLVHYETWAAGF